MSIETNLVNNSQICPECGGNIIMIEDTGETVCMQCGLILEDRGVDFSHNGRRAYDNLEKNSREQTGAPISILVPDISLTTTIKKSEISNPNLKRAAKWDTRITWHERNLLIATTELKRISSNLNIPDYVIREAMRLYKIAFNKKLLRGRSINGMVAACVYYVVRKERIPLTFQEILDESAENEKDVKRCYSALIRELKLNLPSRDPSNLIPRFISKLELSSDIQSIATKIVTVYTERFRTSGKDPRGICAGAIYLASLIKKREITQKEIADTIGVTEVTLRSRYKELKKKLNIKIQV